MNKFKLNNYLAKVDPHSVNSIADQICDALNDDFDVDFNDEKSGLSYLMQKIRTKPNFTVDEVELLSEPIIHLVSMNKSFSSAEKIQDTLNLQFDLSVCCELQTLDGDDYLIYEEAIADVLIDHFA